MKLRMYSNGYPQGRCAVLAKELHRTTKLTPHECLQLAQRLFDAQFSQENAAIVEKHDAASSGELKTVCEEFGIKVEKHD